jgi:creatinine amidohydrolase/Fe(II)-dependent formamide hydrolase-like protein
MTQSGVMGMATLGKKEKGDQILQAAVDRIAEFLIEFNNLYY